jgi:GNAT superfamily N-acetyltransferase
VKTCTTRRAAISDATAACEVVRRSIVELCHDDHKGDEASLVEWLANKTPANFEQWIGSKQHISVVAERNNELLGFALLNLRGTIDLLYVSPNARFSGISKALLAALEQAAIAAAIRELKLESSATALRFYTRCGYTSAGPPGKGFGITSAYPMSRQLGTGSGRVVPSA